MEDPDTLEVPVAEDQSRDVRVTDSLPDQILSGEEDDTAVVGNSLTGSDFVSIALHSRRLGKRKTSKVWDYFRQAPKFPGKQNAVVCQICDSQLSAPDCNTTNLRQHLKARHRQTYREMILKETPVKKSSSPPPSSPRSLNAIEVTLAKGVAESWTNKTFSDVEIHFPIDGVTLKCHKLVLAALSPVFRSILSLEGEADRIILPDVNGRTFDSFLECVCLGKSSDDQSAFVPEELKFLRFQVTAEKGQFVIKETFLPEEKKPAACVGRSKSSPVWNYFTSCDNGSANCDGCGQNIKFYAGSTSAMRRHLRRMHSDKFHEFKDSRKETEDKNPVLSVKKEVIKEKIKVANTATPKQQTDPAERTCPQCKKVFSSRPAMRYHLKVVHSGVRPYKCQDCGTTFARLDSFKGHTHSNVKSFLCSLCGKTFGRRNIRDQHEKNHYGEKKFGCNFCDRNFSTKQQKKNHERIHTGEKPYQCTECGKQFAQQHQLTTHFRIHTGEKPYSCNYCSLKFRHMSSQRSHKCEGKIIQEIQDNVWVDA